MKHQHIIAIDPDVSKSGVAYLHTPTKMFELSSLAFPQLLDYLQFIRKNLVADTGNKVLIIVEAGWLIKTNWHVNHSDNRRTSSAKGNAAGRNHEVGRKIVEMCRHYGLEVIEQRPLAKAWRGSDKKITHDELVYFTGIMSRTNQEERDAALLAWNYAGFPIKVKPIK